MFIITLFFVRYLLSLGSYTKKYWLTFYLFAEEGYAAWSLRSRLKRHNKGLTRARSSGNLNVKIMEQDRLLLTERKKTIQWETRPMMIAKKVMVFGIGIIWILAASALAAEESTAMFPPANPEQPNYAELSYPQIAEVTGDNVNVRSGAGQYYYVSGRLNKGDKVTVVEVQQDTWAKILPPEGCYSWIAKKYVQLSPDNPMAGVVTVDDDGSGARVWAGSDFVQPLHSNSQQVKLYRGDVVELAATSDMDLEYYKIKPPAGAHLYISMNYLKFLGTPEEQKPLELPERPDTQEPVTKPEELPMDNSTEPAPINEFAGNTSAPAKEAKPEPKKKSQETKALEQIMQLSDLIDQELTKPLPSQDFSVIKKAIEAIQDNPETGKAILYARLLLERVARYELAAEINKELANQDEDLDARLSKIAQAHQAQRQMVVSRESRYLFTGTVKLSHVYTGNTVPKRYLLTDRTGKILCYAMPGNPMVQVQMDSMVGKTAGLDGAILTDRQGIITTVLVSKIELLDKTSTPQEMNQK